MDQPSVTTASSSQFSLSSRSGSSKSAASEVSGKDHLGDNTMSPIDLELKIQTDRLIGILDDVIYKSKIVICLPDLIIKDCGTLSGLLSPEHLEDLMIIYNQYNSSMYSSTSLLNMDVIEAIKAGDFELKNRLCPEMCHLMYFLSRYPTLRSTINKMIEEMKKNAAELVDACPPPPLQFLYTLEQARSILVTHLETSAADHLANKLRNRKTAANNQKLKQEIADLKTAIRDEQKVHVKEMAAKQKIRKELENKLKGLFDSSKHNDAKAILDSERQMVLMTKAHNHKKEFLIEEEVMWTENYDTVLQKNMRDEKSLRARRNKVETQLKSWLVKYDGEMTEKRNELDELTGMFEDQQKLIEELEAKLAEQDKEYNIEMEEREKEYHGEMTTKLKTFQREHAARVIQFAWRSVLANREAKRKLKRLMKKAAAAANKSNK